MGETIFPWFPTAIPATGVIIVLIGWWLSCSPLLWRGLVLLLLILPILLTSLITMFVSTATPFLNVPVRALFVLPYFTLALGAGWGTLPRLSLRIGITGLIGITWIFSLFNYYTGQHFINPIYATPVRQVAREIASQADPHDLVVGEEDSGFSYYYERTAKKAPYFEAYQAASIITYITTHPVEKVWLVTVGRDATRWLTPLKLMDWLVKNYRLDLEQGYTELDPVYRKMKEFLLHRPTYRYRLLVQRYERIP